MEYIVKIKRKRRNIFNDAWVWKMAWLDGKKNLSRLLLFISSIVIGIAGLVAINSLNANLQGEIDAQAQGLLGADLSISANNPFEEEFASAFDSMKFDMSEQAGMASMVNILRTQQSRLVRVLANSEGYPFYGEVETLPADQFNKIHQGQWALVDENLAVQYEISSDDSIKVGNLTFKVAGVVTKFPGSNNFTTTFTPSVYIGYQHLDSTGLVQYGSRVGYKRFFKFNDPDSAEIVKDQLWPTIKKYGHNYETAQSRKENLGAGVDNLYKFFNLLTFIALILGCIGVASSVHIYIQEKKQFVAMLRCVGTTGWQAFNIYFLQVALFGFIGSLVGVVLGVVIQYVLPLIFSSYFPIDVAVFIVWPVLIEGLIIGLVISLLFSVLPLVSVRFVPPLSVLRPSGASEKRPFSKTRLVTIVLIVVFPLAFAVYQTKSFAAASFFFIGLSIAFVLLWGVGKLLMALVKKYFRNNWSFIWKQGLSNLYRPNNQTSVLVVVIGLGAFLIATLSLIQNSLLQQVEFVGGGNMSNTIMFDIQPHQVEGVEELMANNGLEALQSVPIITTRLAEIKGSTVREIQKDTTDSIPNWALTREFRVTYRDSLIKSEKLIEGTMLDEVLRPTDTAFVTISEGFHETLNVGIGDSVVFDVQGVPVTTVIGGIRDVEWSEDPPNFIFVFPKGVLEKAPQFNVITTNIEDKQKGAKFQRELVAAFPNVSLIDLTLIIKTLSDFFDKVAFIIQFLALFSVATGLVVLSGAVVNSKYLRLKENVMLRTIGARKKHIVGITLAEYLLLGSFASVTGTLLSMASAWALCKFLFKINFFLDWQALLLVLFAVIGLTLLIGWLNSRSIVGKSPLEVLRKEV